MCLFRENSSVCDHAYILRDNLKPVTTRIIFNELLVRSAEFRISPLSFSSKALLSWVGFKGLLSLKLQRVSKVDFVYNMSGRTMICNFAFICSHLQFFLAGVNKNDRRLSANIEQIFWKSASNQLNHSKIWGTQVKLESNRLTRINVKFLVFDMDLRFLYTLYHLCSQHVRCRWN